MLMKFLNMDKENFLYSSLILSLIGIIIFSCTTPRYEPQKKENKYYFGHKYKPQQKIKK